MEYIFEFKRRLFWQKRKVSGHRYDKSLDKMILYYKNGGLEEIARWNGCDLKLGNDWALAVREQMERETGQQIRLNPDIEKNRK